MKRRKLNYFGHMIRADNLPSFICQGYGYGKRARGRPRRRWMNDVEEWMHGVVDGGLHQESDGQRGMENTDVVGSGLRSAAMRMVKKLKMMMMTKVQLRERAHSQALNQN